MNKFGERLKELRLKKNMSLQELSEDLGISDYALILWEGSKLSLDITKIIKLAKYFNVTLDYIMGL